MLQITCMVLGPVETNVYLVVNEETKESFVVDPADHTDVIEEQIESTGATPTAILLTHGHYDHIGAAAALRERYKIPVMVMKAEEELLEKPQLNLSARHGFDTGLKADRLLNDGEEIAPAGVSIKVLHTPGHTGGGVCYYLKEQGVLFAGDTLFKMSVGRTDFPTGDMNTLLESIREKLFVLPDETKVLPGHGPDTSIGFEKVHNFFLRS